MLSREDFAFTIGYDGERAVIDGKARSQYGSLGTTELAEKGLYRAAFASDLWAMNQEGTRDKATDKSKVDAQAEMEALIAHFNKVAGTSYSRPEDLQRLFGVALETVTRTLVL